MIYSSKIHSEKPFISDEFINMMNRVNLNGANLELISKMVTGLAIRYFDSLKYDTYYKFSSVPKDIYYQFMNIVEKPCFKHNKIILGDEDTFKKIVL